MFDLAILGLLGDHDCTVPKSAWTPRNTLASWRCSFGSDYPALTRLEKSGPRSRPKVGRPETPMACPVGRPTGSLSGSWPYRGPAGTSPPGPRRGRKVYRITTPPRRAVGRAAGRQRGHPRRRSFGLRLAFARHLAPQARLASGARRAQLVQRLGEAEAARRPRRLRRSVCSTPPTAWPAKHLALDPLIASERTPSPPPWYGAGDLTEPRSTDKETCPCRPPPRHRRRRQLRQLADPGHHLLTAPRPRHVCRGRPERGARRLSVPTSARSHLRRRPDQEWAPTSARPSGRAHNTMRFAEVGELGVTVQRGPTFDGLGLYYHELIRSRRPTPSTLPPARDARWTSSSPTCRRLRESPAPLRPGLPRRRRSIRERHPRLHRLGPRVGPRARAHHRRRHQEPGRLDHRPPNPDQLFRAPGLALDVTYQLNFGGNMDFKNMLERKLLSPRTS